MNYFTLKGYKLLRNSLDELMVEYDQKVKEMATIDRDAKIAESSEFLRARFNLTYTYSNKRNDIISKLNNAIIIEDTEEYKNWDGNTVSRKCEVTINFEGDKETYTILGYNETDIDNNIISSESPLAERLLGHKVGDFVDFNGLLVQILNIKAIDKDLVNEQVVNLSKGLK